MILLGDMLSSSSRSHEAWIEVPIGVADSQPVEIVASSHLFSCASNVFWAGSAKKRTGIRFEDERKTGRDQIWRELNNGLAVGGVILGGHAMGIDIFK